MGGTQEGALRGAERDGAEGTRRRQEERGEALGCAGRRNAPLESPATLSYIENRAAMTFVTSTRPGGLLLLRTRSRSSLRRSPRRPSRLSRLPGFARRLFPHLHQSNYSLSALSLDDYSPPSTPPFINIARSTRASSSVETHGTGAM